MKASKKSDKAGMPYVNAAKSFIFLNLILLMASHFVFAGTGVTTYQAKIIKPDGYPLEASSVNFRFTILNPAGNCVLFSENYSSVSMAGTGGLISFALGSGVKIFPPSSTTFENVFSNITPSLACDADGPLTYSPGPNDTRKIVMQFNAGSGWQTLPAMSINAVPYAMFANTAKNLNGKSETDFVQVSSLPLTCALDEALHFNGASFSCLAVSGSGPALTSGSVITALGYTPTNSASFTTLSSSLSATNSGLATVSSTVNSLSGSVSLLSSTVTSLSNEVAAMSATVSGLNTSMTALSSAVGLMTSSQWVTSGTSISYSSGNVLVSGGLQIAMDSSLCSTVRAGTLRFNLNVVEYCDGSSWLEFEVSGTRLFSLNGLVSGSQTFSTGFAGTMPSISSVNSVHTFNIPYAASAGVTAGLLSFSDFSEFKNKLNATSGAIISALGYTPVNGTDLAAVNSALTSVSATVGSKITSSAAAIAEVLGYIPAQSGASIASLDLGSASATGILSTARLPAFAGDITSVSGSAVLNLVNSGVTAGVYNNVTVDSKGRVISGTSLTSADIISALGYTPSSSGTGSSFQIADDASVCPGASNIKVGALRFTAGTKLQVCLPTGWSDIGTSNNNTLTGTYSGTGTSSQSIVLGFRPKFVVVKSINGSYGGQTIAIDGISASASHLRSYDSSNIRNTGISGNVTITDAGFDVTGTVNDSTFNFPGGTYYYVALGVTNNSLWTATGNNTYFNSGNVGIGTVTPSSALEVSGTLRVSQICDRNGNNCQTISSGWGGAGAGSVSATATTNGYLTFADWNLFNSKLSTLDLGSTSATGILSPLRLPAFSGDVISTAASSTLNVVGLRGISLSNTSPSSGQVLSFNGSQWIPTTVSQLSGSSSASTYATIYKITSQTFPVTYTWYDINLDAEGVKQNINHSNTVNPSRVQVALAGLYKVDFSINFKGGAGTVNTRLMKNGSSEVSGSFMSEFVAGTDATALMSTSLVVALNAGDYLTLQGYVNDTNITVATYSGSPVTRTSAVFTITSLDGGHSSVGGGILAGLTSFGVSGSVLASNGVSATWTTLEALTNGQNNSMFTGWPDVIRCSTTNPVTGIITFFISDTNRPDAGYNGVVYRAADFGATQYFVVYNIDGTHNANNIGTTNCNTTISNVVSAGRGFNFAKGPAGQWLASGTSTYLNSGNAGIGTSNPGATLDVSGTLRVSQICDRNGFNCQTLSNGWTGSSGSVSATIAFRVGHHANNAAITFTGPTDYIPDTKIMDTHSAFNLATREFTAPEAGYYLFGWNFYTGGATTTSRRVYLMIDSGSGYASQSVNGDIGAAYNGSQMIYLSAGHKAKLYVPSGFFLETYSAYGHNSFWGMKVNAGGSTFTSVDLGSSSATGILSPLRLPAFTGDVNSSAGSSTLTLSNTGVIAGAYNKVTVDAKGRVVSGTNLTANDVTSALGFTPAVSGAQYFNGMPVNSIYKWPNVISQLASAPGSPGVGTLYYNTTSSKLFLYSGLSWVHVDNSAGNLKYCSENDNCAGTVKYCHSVTPDSNLVVSSPSKTFGYGSWSNSSCGISGSGWYANTISSCSTGTGSFIGRCNWVIVEDSILATLNSTLADSDSDTLIWTEKISDEDKIRFDTAGIERMIINSLGFIGIGTSSPTTPLTVSGVIRSVAGGFQFPDGSVQTSSAGVYQTSCTPSGTNGNISLCCQVVVATGAATCKFAATQTSAWNAFTHPPFTATTAGSYSISCTAGSSYNSCCRTNNNTGATACVYNTTSTAVWTPYTNNPF